jgi:hypothetical protein
MKEKIIGVMSYPYLDKLVVKVGRQLNRFHVPTERVYSVSYSDSERVYRLVKLSLTLNTLLQFKIVASRIARWESLQVGDADNGSQS